MYDGTRGCGLAQMGVDAYDLASAAVLATTRVPNRRWKCPSRALATERLGRARSESCRFSSDRRQLGKQRLPRANWAPLRSIRSDSHPTAQPTSTRADTWRARRPRRWFWRYSDSLSWNQGAASMMYPLSNMRPHVGCPLTILRSHGWRYVWGTTRHPRGGCSVAWQQEVCRVSMDRLPSR